MKATMKGDQTFPVRAISKDALNRKETGARTPGTRFDDVLSGLAEARNSSAKTTTHRVSESATRLMIGRSADSLQPRSSEDVDSILSDGEAADSAVPKDALHQHDATGSQHFRLPSEQILLHPQAAMVLTPADSPGPGIEGSLATHVRKDGDVRRDPGGQTHPADMPAGRLTERSVAGARPVTEAAIRLDIPPKHPIAF
jgi:hypothetical protein